MKECKCALIPAPINQRQKGDFYDDPKRYCRIFKSLAMHHFHQARPRHCLLFFFFPVKEVSKFMHEKRAGFMDSIKWTQRDRKGTISNELVYTQSTLLKRDSLRCGNLFIQMQIGQYIRLQKGLFFKILCKPWKKSYSIKC